jgi:hypothetical protein
MRKIGKIIALVCLIITITLTGCANIENNNNEAASNEQLKAQDAEKPVPIPFEDSQAKRAYWSVLKNYIKFFSTEENSYTYLDEFDYQYNYDYGYKIKSSVHRSGDYRDHPWEVFKFAVVDMDGDNHPEILLELFDQVEVLHYEENIVYGYCFPIRDMENLKTDGNFGFLNSASTAGSVLGSGYGRLFFSKEKYELIKLGGTFYNTDEEGQSKKNFYIAEEQVSEDIYSTFYEKQNEKENVTWYEFTDENIDALLRE